LVRDDTYIIWNSIYFENNYNLKNKNDAISKSTPNDLKFSYVVDMASYICIIFIQTKSKPVLTIFEQFTELWNFEICQF